MFPSHSRSRIASVAIALLIILSLAMPKPSLADPINAFEFQGVECYSGYVEFYFLFSIAPNENRTDYWTLHNPGADTTSTAIAGAEADSSGQDFQPGYFDVPTPADTQVGDTLDLTVEWTSIVGQSGSTTYTFASPCSNEPGVTWFNPGDARVDGRPGDRIAVWCNATATPPTVVVYGVGDYATNGSHGFLLGVFNNADLLKAGAKGITKDAGPGNGTISAMQDGKGDFYVAWNGGIFKATGQRDFAKSFSCQF